MWTKTGMQNRKGKIGIGEKKVTLYLAFSPNIKLVKTTSFVEDPVV